MLFGIRSVPTMVLMSSDIKPISIPATPDKNILMEIIDNNLNRVNKDSNDN